MFFVLGADARELLAGAERLVDDRARVEAFSFVRTNAPPLPGFTCWNSTIRHVCPSSSMCIPFGTGWWRRPRPSARECSSSPSDARDRDQLLRERRQQLDAVVADDREILDPHAAEPGR